VPAPGRPDDHIAVRRCSRRDRSRGRDDAGRAGGRRRRDRPGDDLHWTFSVETAIRPGRRLEPFDLAFIEDPVHPEKLDAQRRVRRAIAVPILTGELVATATRFGDLLAADAVDVAIPDVTRCGGLAELRRIAGLRTFTAS
jgi:hypothetical protein